jgi:2-C-methyl-D-erythritol 4-phosphate cytidylyltransferase
MESPESSAATVLIPAAGSGRRVGNARNKVLLPLGGVPLIVHTLRAFQAHPGVGWIGLIVREADRAELERALPPGPARHKLLPWIVGGAERQDSVYKGLEALAGRPPRRVLVHDGARPLVGAALIGRVLAALADAEGCVPVLPIEDTVRRISGPRGTVLERSELFRTQTPQGFRWEPLWRAHREARAGGLRGTDDAQLLETAGGRMVYVPGEPENLKITTPADLRYAEWLLQQRDGAV